MFCFQRWRESFLLSTCYFDLENLPSAAEVSSLLRRFQVLFFACTAPAVAFGGLLARATNGLMGTVEAVGATAIGGITYALFSGRLMSLYCM